MSSKIYLAILIIIIDPSSCQILAKRKPLHQSILPKPGECGQVRSNDEYRDENEIAQLGQFPWTAQVAFFNLQFYDYRFICNAVLINSNHLLTAGICVIPISVGGHYRTGPYDVRIYVRLGDWNPNTTVDCNEGICGDPQIEILVERTFTRVEKSLERPWVNNIGIIKLVRSVEYTNWISPICLPVADHFHQDDQGYIGATFISTGWHFRADKPELKYKINVKVIEDDQCDEIYNRERKANKYYDPYTNFCIFRENKNGCKTVTNMMAIDTTNVLQPYWYVVGIPVQAPLCRGFTMCEKVVTHMQWIKYILSLGYGEYDENRLPYFDMLPYNYSNQKGQWLENKNVIFKREHINVI